MPIQIFNNLNSTIAQNRLDLTNRNLGDTNGRVASGDRDIDGAEQSVSELLRSDAPKLRQSTKNLIKVDDAIDTNVANRESIGVIQNRFNRALYNLNIAIENLTTASATVKDSDFSEKHNELTRQQLLVQSSAAMAGQENLIPDRLLLLLQ